MGEHCEQGGSSEMTGEAQGAGRAYAYSINDIVRTFGISRTTIMYYESLGIVTPRREGDQARRVYSDADVYRLMSAMLFKNAGIPPKGLADVLDGQPFTAQRCAACAQIVEREIAYKQAVLERMRLCEQMCTHVGDMGACDVEPYYFVPDKAEVRYRKFPEDNTLDLLIAHMPLGGLGSQDHPEGQAGPLVRWGRTIPVRYAGFVDGLSTEGLGVIGGCACVWTIRLVGDIRRPERQVGIRVELRDYARGLGMTPTGLAFTPFSLPSEHGFIVPVCIPVTPAEC